MANTTGKKFGGRQPGTPNKSSQELRNFVHGFLEQQLEDLDEVFQKLKPKDKVNAIMKMFPYVLPKQMEMEVSAPQEQEELYDLSVLSDEEHSQLELIMKKIKINGSNHKQIL